MALIDSALDRVLHHEGLYSDDPIDPGRETFKGISRIFHPDWEGWEIIDSIKLQSGSYDDFLDRIEENDLLHEHVSSFYYVAFWEKLKLNKIESQKIAEEVFEFAVNSGIKTSVLALQKSINLIKVKNFIVEDGIIGPVTIDSTNDLSRKSYHESAFIKALNGYQFNHYVGIVENDARKKRFIRGWLNRI